MRDIIDDRFERPAADRPLARFQQMEVDAFCDGCGYNLHGQRVERDPRLDLSVCRCPECGRWHAAGKGTSASSVWLSRLGVFLIAGWGLAVLGAVLALGTFMGLSGYLHLEGFTTTRLLDASGRRVEFRPSNGLATNPSVAPGYYVAGTNERVVDSEVLPYKVVRKPEPVAMVANPPYAAVYARQREAGDLIALCFLIGFSVVAGLLLGGFAPVALWHVPKRRLAVGAVWPFVAAAGAYGLWVAAENTQFVTAWSLQRLGGYAALQSAAYLAGLRIGRPVARFLAKVIVPPKPRQVLAFLWRADGLAPPKAGEMSK